MKKLRATILWAGCALACALVQTPAWSQDLTKVTFQLNWVPGGSNAGWAAAIAEGYYKEVGLDVELVPGNGAANTAQMVASGQAMMGAADGTTTSQLIAKGAPFTVVATIYQSNPNAVQALEESGIKSLADLKGKKIAVPSGSSQTTMLPLLLQHNNLSVDDLNLVNMPGTSMIAALLQKQVDAILGSIDSYGIQLDKQGAKYVTFPFSTNGVPTVGTSIIVNSRYASENADLVKGFVAATLKGWAFAAKDPTKAIADLKEVFPNVDVDRATAELTAALKGNLLCAAGAKFIGKAEAESWANTEKDLAAVKLLPAADDPTKYYTYDFLPAESEMTACPRA